MITLRIVSAIVLLPLVLVATWVGGFWFTLLAAASATGAAIELGDISDRLGYPSCRPIALILAVGLVFAGYFLSNQSTQWTTLLPVIVLVVGLTLVSWLYLCCKSRRGQSAIAATTVLVGCTVGGLLMYAPLLRGLEHGREWVLFLLLTIFITDTGAFLVGRSFGKRKLAPSISPSKTWEGSLGGLMVATASAIALYYVLGIQVFGLGVVIILGATVSLLGQFGDMAESKLKRIAGVKDSGGIFPGHGGFLDRLDSIVFALIVVYYSVS